MGYKSHGYNFYVISVEEVNEQDKTLVTGRLSSNFVVHFPGTEEMIGKIVKVELKECKGFYFYGEAAKPCCGC